jgi:hypothetical protein
MLQFDPDVGSFPEDPSTKPLNFYLSPYSVMSVVDRNPGDAYIYLNSFSGSVATPTLTVFGSSIDGLATAPTDVLMDISGVVRSSNIVSTLTGKTYNGLSLTALTTGFSVAGGSVASKTLTINNTLTLAGTDSSTLDIGSGGTLGTGAFATISNYARKDTANAFTVGGHTIANQDVSTVGLTIKPFTSGTYSQVWQSATPSTVSTVGANGAFAIATFGGTYGSNYGLSVGSVSGATGIPVGIRGSSAQTGDLIQFQSSTPAVLGGRNAVAQIYSGSTAPITSSVGGATTAASGTSTTATLTMTTATNLAVGDLIVVAGVTPTGYNTTGAVVTAVSNTSPFTVSYANATTGAQTVAGTVSTLAQASVTARSAGTKGLIVKAATSQAVNLQEWQDASGNIISKVVAGGGVIAVEPIVSATASAGSTTTLDASTGTTFTLTFGAGNITGLLFTNLPNAGSTTVTLILKQDGTGSRTITWSGTQINGSATNAVPLWAASSPPVLSTAANAVDVVTLVINRTAGATDNVYGFLSGKAFA